jgi:hypothetical protein
MAQTIYIEASRRLDWSLGFCLLEKKFAENGRVEREETLFKTTDYEEFLGKILELAALKRYTFQISGCETDFYIEKLTEKGEIKSRNLRNLVGLL